ncbi:hypothetical protein EDD18DRAFT_1364522 [Armillaria luteobubalina]|uniref:Uncharacterized protein n=1 Tax=Armillaria luteobubalina TaxID=153913 RepID=A0AA39P6V6_9AGAR|nr:hypothetical protein EDD18DRAFT_1364522 [Armillaria luteobubalina]
MSSPSPQYLTLLGVLPIMGMHEYAVQHDYTAEQREWMAHQGALFEGAVQDNRVLIFLARLFDDWFDRWPVTDDRSDAAVAQLKVELSTLYIMGLKNQWLVHGMRPEGWSEELVLAKLDYLEDMVVTLWELQRVFVVERADSNMVYDLRTRKILSLKLPPPPRLIARPQPDKPPSQCPMSCPRSSSNNMFTPPPAPDAAVELIRCIDDVQVSLGFIQQRAICHLSTIQGAMMSTWHYPAWQQKNGYLTPVTAENLQQYMREWEVEGPNCFCPLMDPTSSQVQAILRRDDGDGQWSFICVSEYCEYRINLTRVFSPGLPQSALQNYAIGAPRTENLDYRTYEERWEEKHGRRWPLLQTGLSDIEESIEPDTTSVRAPGTVVPESDQEEGPNSPPVPRLDLTKRVPTSPTRNRRIVNPVTTRSKLGSTAKERRLSLQVQGAGGDSVQTEGGVLAKAPTGFCETTLFRETIPVLRRRDLWIHLTQTAVGVTSEELAGLLVKCGGCSKYYRDGLNHYCVE